MERDIEAAVAFIAARMAAPFAWGRSANDCAAFAGGVVKALTGVDPLKGLRWGSEAGAVRLLARLGGLEAAMDARFARVAPAKAHRFDIAGVPDESLGIRLMIVEGVTLVGPGTRGLARLSRAAAEICWDAVSHV